MRTLLRRASAWLQRRRERAYIAALNSWKAAQLTNDPHTREAARTRVHIARARAGF